MFKAFKIRGKKADENRLANMRLTFFIIILLTHGEKRGDYLNVKFVAYTEVVFGSPLPIESLNNNPRCSRL